MDSHMAKSYTVGEATKSLFDMYPTKVLGPNGFHAIFFHTKKKAYGKEGCYKGILGCSQ